MRRQHLYFIVPVLVVIAALVLFFQRDKVTEGSGAHMPPNTSTNPMPSGMTSPADRNSTPGSAMQRAPSGEAARPTERR